MEPLTIAEPSPNHPADAPLPDNSEDAAIIAEIENAMTNCRSPAFLRHQIKSILHFYEPVVHPAGTSGGWAHLEVGSRSGFHNHS